MSAIHIIFYLFATVSVVSAYCVITAHHPVRSVLSLVVTFFATAGIWMILHAEFLSLILVLVYVGAVMTLFLFVVMMLNVNKEADINGYVRYLPFGAIVVLLLGAILLVAIGGAKFGVNPLPTPEHYGESYSNVAMLGDQLYTTYLYPFEIAGVLLLAAIVAAITLTHRGPRKRKVQEPSKQINVRREDRVRLIKMQSEPKKGPTS